MSPVDLEPRIRATCDAGDHTVAAALVVERYGPELLGFIMSRLRSESDAHEVFSIFCEDLLAGIPRFEWRSSVRAWAYTLARHAAVRYVKAPANRRDRRVPLSHVPELAERVRTTTAVYRKTEVKSRMRALREQLPDEDQTILILRVDKGLSWREVALVLCDETTPPDDLTLGREAARVRKRFQLAKDRLRELAQADGLL